MRFSVITKEWVWVCVYANMINMFIVIISGWWDYWDNYFLFAGLNFLQAIQVVFITKHFKEPKDAACSGHRGERGEVWGSARWRGVRTSVSLEAEHGCPSWPAPSQPRDLGPVISSPLPRPRVTGDKVIGCTLKAAWQILMLVIVLLWEPAERAFRHSL